MRLFVPHRIKFHGLDPPPFIQEPVVQESVTPVDPKAKPVKNAEPVAPTEVQKTPEEIAAQKLYIKFMKQLRKEVDRLALDVTEYRQITLGPEAIKKVPLWPKVFTDAEIKALQE